MINKTLAIIFIVPVAEVKHSIQVKVPRHVVWSFWSDPSNWALDPGIESVEMDGPFAPGTVGRTKTRDGTTRWTISKVEAGKSAVIELNVGDTHSRIAWTFSEASGQVTSVTQKMTFQGPQAEEAAEVFRETLPGGMAKLAEAIEASWQ